MQKSQLASVLLRSQHRCLQSTTLERRLASLRHFHYSSINAAEQDVRDTQAQPDVPPSKPRHQDTTAEIERVFEHGTRFYGISQRRGGEADHPIRYTINQPKARINDQQAARTSPLQPGAIDARNLPAQHPSSSPRPSPAGRRSPAPGGAIDARNLAAQNRPPSSYPSEDRQRPLIRRVMRDDDSTRSTIARSNNRTSGGPPRREPRSSVDASSRRPPSGPAPRKRSRSGEGALGGRFSHDYDLRSARNAEPLDPKAWEYLEEKEERTPKAVAYAPADVTLETLRGNGPAMPLGEWGMKEVVEEWLDRIAKKGERKHHDLVMMVEKMKTGEHVAFGDKETKDRVLDAVENGMKDMSEEEQGAVVEKLKETFGSEFADSVFKGKYEFEGRKGAGVLASLAMQTTKNGSFRPEDGESLSAKVTALLPAEQPRGGGKAARS